MVLSPRLQLIFEQLLPNQPVWDFCCDHGYLGTEALKNESFPEVIFVDPVPHILGDLQQNLVRKFPLQRAKARFLVQRGEEVQEEVRGNVVIAGVGAHTIYKILENLSAKNHLSAARLILAPQRDAKKLKEWLSQGAGLLEQFHLSTELALLEKDRRREVLIYDRVLGAVSRERLK